MVQFCFEIDLKNFSDNRKHIVATIEQRIYLSSRLPMAPAFTSKPPVIYLMRT